MVGSELGYSLDRRQGPAVVRWIVRAWQRHDRAVRVEELSGPQPLDTAVELTVRPGGPLPHPHQLDGSRDKHVTSGPEHGGDEGLLAQSQLLPSKR
jgi:hypothetical protein